MHVALESVRVGREISVRELADAVGVDADTIRRYESGKEFPRAEDMAALQAYFGTVFNL